MSVAGKLTAVADNASEAHKAGRLAEYDTCQDYGNLTFYTQAFSCHSRSDTAFKLGR